MKRITTQLVALASSRSAPRALGPRTRTPRAAPGALAGASGSTTVCENGTNPGTMCSFSGDCTGGGTCTGVANVQVKARGLLTIIADTKPLGDRLDADDDAGLHQSLASTGTPGSCETGDNATFTLLLEFTLNAKKYTYAETFVRLPDGNACPAIPN